MDEVAVRERIYKEEKLAELLNMPIADVFKQIEIPTNRLELAHRINKMRALGVDCSLEESIREMNFIDDEIDKIKEILSKGPGLKAEHVKELTGKLQGVIDGLQGTDKN